jgi:protein-S-isoprenylcysteine O-methyltransferase Ste14
VTVLAEAPGGDRAANGHGRAPRGGLLAGWIRLALMTIVYGLSLFACAGTVAWPAAWAYLGLMTVMLAGYMVIVGRHPDLVAERRKPPADAKAWDKPLVAVIGVVGPVALLLACGFDRRFHWSPPMSAAWKAAGLLLVGFGSALSNWAVAANRFFSAIIRIQRDRGHHVVDTGPYRLVRHPGYLASMVHMPGVALALGSWRGLAVVAAVGVVVIVRTALEDRTLRAELEGYAEYAGRVRYRLLPGVW